MKDWYELGDGVFCRRYAELDLTVGLVLGEHSALIIDTRGDHVQGAELARAVRSRTSLPRHVVLTHGHFDHCFGTGPLQPVAVWAQERCSAFLRATAQQQRTEWIEHYRTRDPEIADALATTELLLPDHPVRTETTLELGGRVVELAHLGPGHTDHDLVVRVPDADVLFAGDLVEHGAPPDFSDARPALWPSTLDRIIALAPTVIVPGHGAPVAVEFVREQNENLRTVAQLCLAVADGELTINAALERSPYPPDSTREALRAHTRVEAP